MLEYFSKTLLFLALFLQGHSVSTAHARGLPAQEGIVNFAKVSELIYRGAQPDAVGIQNLQRLGIKTIVDLRMPGDVWKAEDSEARAHGILHTNLPLHGFGRPADEQIKQILSLIETVPGP